MTVSVDSTMIIKSIEVKSVPQTLPYPNKKRRVGFSHQNPLEVVVGGPKHREMGGSFDFEPHTYMQDASRKKSISLQEFPDGNKLSKEDTKLLLQKLRGQLSLQNDAGIELGVDISSEDIDKQRLRSSSLKNHYNLERVKVTEARSTLKTRLGKEKAEESDFFELDFSKSLEKNDSVKSARKFDCNRPLKQRTETLTSTSTTQSYDSEGSAQSTLSFSNNASSTLDRRSVSSRRGSSKSPCPQNFIPGENKGRKFVHPLSFFRKTSVCFHGVNIRINQDAPRTFRAVVYAGILGLVIPSPSKHGCKGL